MRPDLGVIFDIHNSALAENLWPLQCCNSIYDVKWQKNFAICNMRAFYLDKCCYRRYPSKEIVVNSGIYIPYSQIEIHYHTAGYVVVHIPALGICEDTTRLCIRCCWYYFRHQINKKLLPDYDTWSMGPMKPNLLTIEPHHNKTKHNKTTCLYYWIYCALVHT